MKAIETTGRLEKKSILRLDKALSIKDQRVKVIILYGDEEEILEGEWLQGLSKNPSFQFLKDKAEDLYSIKDGKPFKK